MIPPMRLDRTGEHRGDEEDEADPWRTEEGGRYSRSQDGDGRVEVGEERLGRSDEGVARPFEPSVHHQLHDLTTVLTV